MNSGNHKPADDGNDTARASGATLIAQPIRLNDIIAAMPVGIAVIGADGTLNGHNRRFAELIGFPAEWLGLGLKVDALVGLIAALDDYASVEGKAFLSGLRAPVAPSRQRRARRNGTVIDVATEPLAGGGWTVTVIQVDAPAAADDRKRAATMEAMLNNIHHGIMLWSADKRLIAANQMAIRLSHPVGEAIVPGMNYDEFIRRQCAAGLFGTGPDAEAYARNMIAHDPRQVLRTHRRLHEGGVVETQSAPTPDGGFVTTQTDVTEILRAGDELRQAKEAAETSATSKARFLTTMSHELRTPLNAVIGFSDTILRDRGGTDPAVVREYAEEINVAGKRLLLLINTVLDVSRIEAGRYDLGTDRIDFNRLVPLVLRQARTAAMAGEIELVNAMPPDTPVVRGDERRMQQVLVHLISNAVKFTEPGGSASISAAMDDNGDLLVRVSDSGIGIAEENLDRVFEPFTQLDAGLERRFEGTGLGLYMSRALVEAHGGSLTLRSQLKEGTTAEIRLPERRVVAPEITRLASD